METLLAAYLAAGAAILAYVAGMLVQHGRLLRRLDRLRDLSDRHGDEERRPRRAA